MRILIVSQYFWPEAFRINDIALGLRECGHDVAVLTGLPNYPEGAVYQGYHTLLPGSDSFEGIPVARVPLVPRGAGGRLRLALNYASFALSACLFGPFKVTGSFDAIFIFAPSPITVALPALLLKALRSVPVLLWVQDLWPESLPATGAIKSRWVLSLVERMVRFIYRHSDRVLIQSRAFTQQVERLGTAPDKIVYLPNSAEAFYRPVAVEHDAPERSLVPSGFRIMFAGNIGAAQSFATIIEAAALLRDQVDIHWIILGDGRLREWAAAEVARRQLHNIVHFLGRYPVDAMPRFLALADALLVTLKRDPLFALTIPSKLQSCLACGRPVVAALDGEGARILQEAGAGIVCPADDANALADAVLKLYRMPGPEREMLGARGRAYFDAEFERGILLQRLIRAIQTTVQENSVCAS